MKHQHTIAAAAVGLVGLLTFAGTASAARPAIDLSVAKAKCDAAVAERMVEITKLTTRSNAAKHLSAGHLASIGSTLSSTKSGLTALQTKLDADTDAATLKADCADIATGYRVFALRAPQVHLSIVGDRQSAILAKGNNAATKLETAIQKAAANNKDVTDATAKLADMKAKLADATAKLNGVVDSVLAVTPDQWNANHSVLAGSLQALRAAQADLKAAFADARTIIADLKA